MQIYLVGGAVRDQLLGLPVIEKDWVVVGATPEEMLRLGYRPVGKDFPVFLHPKTHEEYALARTERKTGRGYTAFAFNASPTVSLEEDLQRRDLTINAMALTQEGALIDPYHGEEDLEQRMLRHVSAAFIEDPVRILRVARFAARYAELGFSVAPETIALMKQMVSSGEVDALVSERVWKELEKALGENNPESFFYVLQDCDALRKLFPLITQNNISVLAASTSTTSKVIRFAAFLHSLDENQIKLFCKQFAVPNQYRDLALLVSRYFPTCQKISSLSAEDIVKMLQEVDAFRRPERFMDFLVACGVVSSDYSTSERWAIYWKEARNVDVKKLLDQGFAHQELASKIYQERVRVIKMTKAVD
jgi:tRNA nucleotidyltransferase (CCA-adding enzyme)